MGLGVTADLFAWVEVDVALDFALYKVQSRNPNLLGLVLAVSLRVPANTRITGVSEQNNCGCVAVQRAKAGNALLRPCHYARAFLRFQRHKATRSTSTAP